MGRSIFDQETQVRATRTGDYDDTIAAGSGTLAPGTGSLLDDFNRVRSQIKRILDDSSGNWYDDIPTVNSKQRDLSDLNTDLDDIEEKRVICPVEVLQNITVPNNAYATGTITAVAQANISDTETFTVSDNVNPTVTFEFDTNSSVVETATLRQVDISGDTSAIDVADTMVTAINGAPSLNWTADNASGTSATVTLTHDWGGTHANGTLFTETVSDAGFALVQPTGGAGDVVILDDSSAEAPTFPAAVTGTALGAIVAVLSTDVGTNDLAEQAGTNPTLPKNRCLIRDWQTRDGLTDSKGWGGMIFGLLQAESGVVDADDFNDSDHQAQISFVVINADTDDLVPAAGFDIGGKTVEFVYPRRVSIDTLPEDCGFPIFGFTDGSASVSVTLNNAIDNQGVTPATQVTNIDIDMDSAGVEWAWRDALDADLLKIVEGSAGGTSEVEIGAGVDVFDVDAADVDFLQGITVDSGGTAINVGETAGQIDSAGALSLNSGGSADLTVQSANEIILVDTNKGGSTYAGSFKLSETSTEWDDFETAMEGIFGTGNGEVSLLKGITAAANNTRGTKIYSVYAGPAALAADTDVGGPSATANNLDVDLPDLSSNFTTDHDLYLNGQLLRPGANAAANNDYYPGTTSGGSGTQELKFEFVLKSNDQLCVIPYS